MAYFRYAEDIVERFPDVHGGVIHATGLSNGSSSADQIEAYSDEQADVIAQIGDTPLSEIESIASWRRAFSSFGVKPTQYRNAAEALLRRLTKQGDIPTINSLVDMANLVSIRYRLPVAVFDQSEVSGGTTVGFATGTERFTDLGSDSASQPEPGEVIFVDETGLVSARRWCWRQSAQSAARESTTEAILTVEGQHAGAAEDVGSALHDLLRLLEQHQPQASVSSGILSAGSRSFDPEGSG